MDPRLSAKPDTDSPDLLSGQVLIGEDSISITLRGAGPQITSLRELALKSLQSPTADKLIGAVYLAGPPSWSQWATCPLTHFSVEKGSSA